MKRIFVLTLFAALTGLSYAQQPENNTVLSAGNPAREATDLLVVKYKLNAAQAGEMYTIQERKQRNLAQIRELETSNPALYSSKLESIQNGTLASIRRLLRTAEQRDLYQQTQATVRAQKAEKRKELLASNKPEAEIETVLLRIYAE